MKSFSNLPAKNISWVKIGGPIKDFVEIENEHELSSTIKKLISENQNYKIIGQGSNILISDRGIDQIIIKNKYSELNIGEASESTKKMDLKNYEHLTQNVGGNTLKIQFEDIYYDEYDAPNIIVEVSSGYYFSALINTLLSKGITGLQWFAGIPGTVGGFIANNSHGGTKLISDYLVSVKVINEFGNIEEIDTENLKMGYDQSIFHKKNLVIVSCKLKLFLGDKNRAIDASVKWANGKSNQPKNSLGSMFQNISKSDADHLSFPTTSIGYLVEQKLKLSGYRVGDAMIPINANNNFIINLGNASASNYLEIMKKIHMEAYLQFGLKLKPEVFFWGFHNDELKEFYD